MPIRRSPASRSTSRCACLATRSMMPPTLRHAIRISCATAVLDVFTASHATWSSNARVKRVSWRAHGTAATTTSEIEPWAATPADAAAVTLTPIRPGHDDQLTLVTDPHVLDDGPLQAKQARPYPDAAHVVSPPEIP